MCLLSLTDLELIDLSAMLGRPRAVRIVWVCNPASGGAQRPNYRLLHWRPQNIHGVGFAELNSYDIHGLSAIIARTVPHNAIRYILGATGEGRHQLRLHPAFQLSYIDYMFIENDEGVRAWLLSNPVLEDPLDLLVYCHRPATRERPATPPLRGHDYLHENAVANWAQHAAGRHGLQAPRGDAGADPGPANALGKKANDSPLFHPGSSSSSSVVSDAGEGREASIGTSPSPVGDPGESPAFRIPLGIQSLSQMNTHQGSEQRGGGAHTQDDKVRKRGAHSDSEDLDFERLCKKSRQAASVREWLNAKEDLKRRAQFDDEKGDEDPGSREAKRLLLTMSGEFGRSDDASIVP